MTGNQLLSQLTPAETLFILKPESTLRDLMKYTLMDLFLQEKLQLLNYEGKQAQGESRLAFGAVVIGKKFQQEEPRLHEMIFLFPFYKKPMKRIVVKHLLQMGMSAARNETHFIEKLMLQEGIMKQMFYKGWWQKIFGGIKISKEGKKLKEQIIRQFNFLDKSLPEWLKNDKEKATAVLNEIKGNILLLNSFKFDVVNKIGRELAALEEELETGIEGMPDFNPGKK